VPANFPRSARHLQEVYNSRAGDNSKRHGLYAEIEDALQGRRPKRYEKLWHEDDVPIEFRSIQLAAQDLTALATKVFNVEVAQTGTTKARAEADEKVERIAYGWNEGARNLGGPAWKAIMGEIARLEVLFADMVFGFLPHFPTKTLFGAVKHPNLHFPPSGWSPLSINPLDDTLMAYSTTLGELKRRYDPHGDNGKAAALDKQYGRFISLPGGRSRVPSDSTICLVGEFYGSRAWYFGTLDDRGVRLLTSEEGDPNHPGVCPWASGRQIGFDPLFAGQLGLEIALQKVLSQEIQATDEMLHGPVTGSPLIGGDLHNDRYNVLRTDIPGERIIPPQRLAPTSPVNTQRIVAELMSMLRIANRNPESFQGAGDANSAKAVQTLQAGIRSTVQDIIWVPIMDGLMRAYEAARQMEINLWPLEEKQVRGKRSGEYFEVSYRPITDLADYKARIRVEHDAELGGYQGSLDRQQKVTSKMMSRRTAMEKDYDTRDVGPEWSQIEIESVDALWDQVVAAQGPNLNPDGIARWIELMREGNSKVDAYRMASQEGAFAPPQPAEALAQQGAPDPLAALMAGSPDAMPVPSLAEVRSA
jgi:hypothetical protein